MVAVPGREGVWDTVGLRITFRAEQRAEIMRKQSCSGTERGIFLTR